MANPPGQEKEEQELVVTGTLRRLLIPESKTKLLIQLKLFKPHWASSL